MTLHLKKIFQSYFQIFFISIFILEFLSYLGFLYPQINIFCFIAITLATFFISLKKLEIGVYIVFAELIIGSKGYIFSAPIGSFDLSIRLALFMVVFLAFILDAFQKRKIYFFDSSFLKPYLGLLFFVVLAGFTALLHGNAMKNIFFDANGYLFLGFVFPVFQSLRKREDIYSIMQVLIAAVSANILKSLVLLFIFSQQFVIFLPNIYKWIRVSGVGEITQLNNYFYRIFFQSHIYEVILFFILFTVILFLPSAVRKEDKKSFWSLFTRGTLCLLVVFTSYSRSFWLGSIITLFVFFAFMLFYWKLSIRKTALTLAVLALVMLADFGITFGIVNFPLPNRSANISAASLISERTQDVQTEVAGASRFNLLEPLVRKGLSHPIFGSGFGTTVTYKTEDPRALENNPNGLYTTFSFEWGYLDLWVKLGLLGTIAYAVLLLSIFIKMKKFIKNPTHDLNSLMIGFGFGLLSIIAVHATTPYLNHPLGIGYIIITMSVISILYDNAEESA